ncbi:hypothetical protein SK224_04130 [Microbacterium sp. BG28]|uniref:hypothetical protein n=1 Tax=Microbacterium sp. BG28 TaxID=3097356 RepID=UPI002A5A8FF2|nr:hypothetical protein [Microbacterium sp. BG28]MDY0828310.1 hypothetical protein [Microbacterium sp. BG28]
MRRLFAAVALLAAAIALAGCTSVACGESAGSRATLYDSIEALAADSSLVAVAVVTITERSAADCDTTVTARIDRRFEPAALGGTPTAERNDVVVRHTGPSDTLVEGRSYLLFLTPTMLQGSAADDYFVTGVTAGIYRVEGDHFVHVPSEGDDLPATLTPADLQG